MVMVMVMVNSGVRGRSWSLGWRRPMGTKTTGLSFPKRKLTPRSRRGERIALTGSHDGFCGDGIEVLLKTSVEGRKGGRSSWRMENIGNTLSARECRGDRLALGEFSGKGREKEDTPALGSLHDLCYHGFASSVRRQEEHVLKLNRTMRLALGHIVISSWSWSW